MKIAHWVLCAGLIGLPLAACTETTGPILSATDFAQRYPAMTGALGPGDRLKITLYGDDSLTGEYDVLADGTISLPLVGAVKAAGLTIEQLRLAVETRLAAGFYASPRIAAQVVASRPVYVLGEVNKAGAFPFVPDLTLAKAAALAGGYTYRARTTVVGVRRSGAAEEVLVAADQAMPLAPGDTVRILERHF
jgi:polysaccharide export outer membrane protein